MRIILSVFVIKCTISCEFACMHIFRFNVIGFSALVRRSVYKQNLGKSGLVTEAFKHYRLMFLAK